MTNNQKYPWILPLLLLIGLLFLIFVLIPHFAFARETYPGQYAQVPDNIRSWFKGVHSPGGVPCCDIADGHTTDYEIHTDGYWVPLGGELRHVPPEAVVYDAGNPVGEAVVWYRDYGAQVNDPERFYIRCFVPGGGV